MNDPLGCRTLFISLNGIKCHWDYSILNVLLTALFLLFSFLLLIISILILTCKDKYDPCDYVVIYVYS